jgi:ADP-ribosylglycohydrolase
MHDERLNRARIALEGLSVGDALADQFFMHEDIAMTLIRNRALPKEPWRFTDDTNMALSIYHILRRRGEIIQGELANSFARYYDGSRGYGPAMHGLLLRMGDGGNWQELAINLFSGQGSYGNGGAMRVAPLGAYFADDLQVVTAQARLSAEVTHAHEEGIAGTIAVAIATAFSYQLSKEKRRPDRRTFCDMILQYVPDSEVKSGIRRARDIDVNTSVEHAAAMLGNGYQVTAQDTVPFVIWCAGEYLDNFEEAIWNTLSALGDRDTTCAMVGGIVATYTGIEGIPAEWVAHREPFPRWAFEDE